MRNLALVLATLAAAQAARAQVVPSEPTPAESARAIGVQAAKDPAAAGAALSELFARLAAPRVVLPTWAEIQRDRLRRDLAGSPGRTEPSVDIGDDRAPIDPRGCRNRESVDATLSRPFARIGLGVGWAATDVYRDDERVVRVQDKHAFLSIDLSRVVRPPRLLPPPVEVEHVLTRSSASGVRVQEERYSVDSLALPKN